MENHQEGYKKIDDYVLIKQIGQGQFSKVYLGVRYDRPDELFAIKGINKSLLSKEPKLFNLLQTEAKIMAKISHPNILHLYNFFESDTFYYLVVDYCESGDLDTYMKKHGRFSESVAIYFLKQLMNGFKVLQRYKIIHRDIKLANIYLKTDTVVIGDFGFAKQGVDLTQTRLGTPITMAPEVLVEQVKFYNNKADLWSIGIIFYQLLFNKTPYNAESLEDLKSKVKNFSENKIEFPKDIRISADTADLLTRLLQFDPAKRIDWNDFFNHHLFKKLTDPYEKLANIQDSILYRKHHEKFKKEFDLNVSGALDNFQIEDIQNPNNDIIVKIKEETVQKKAAVGIKSQLMVQGNINQLREKIFHDQKIVLFIILTAREFKNLANFKIQIPSYTGRFLLMSYILIIKGELILHYTIESLKNGYNSFKMPNFEEFYKLEERKEIIKTMEENYQVYKTFEQQVLQTMNSEALSDQLLEIKDTAKYCVYHEISELNGYLKDGFNFFKDKVNLLNVPSTINTYFKLSLIHLFYCVQSETMFPFNLNGKIFDWNSFRFELNDSEIDKTFAALTILK